MEPTIMPTDSLASELDLVIGDIEAELPEADVTPSPGTCRRIYCSIS